MNRFLFYVLMVFTTVSYSTAGAAEKSGLAFGAGVFDVFDEKGDALEYRLEYRHSNIWRNLYPIAGINGTDGGAVYGYAGLNYDIYASDNIVFIPNFAVGAYSQGDDKDLGGALNFRSGIELAYEFESDYRLGMALSHISNASIYDKNPGQESLVVNFTVPVGW
jgi:hypothetical protein